MEVIDAPRNEKENSTNSTAAAQVPPAAALEETNHVGDHATDHMMHPSDQPIPSVERDESASSSSHTQETNSASGKEILQTQPEPQPQPQPQQESQTQPRTQPQQQRLTVKPTGTSQLSNGHGLKIEKEIARLKGVLSESSPTAAQTVLRENWRVFLFEDYNEEHIAFVIRATLKNSSPSILNRVLKDDRVFKPPLLDLVSKKAGVIERVLGNATFDQLLSSVSESVLDRVLAERVKNVPARQLIHWLAEAERLGFKPDDILDSEDESVMPNDRYEEHDVVMSGVEAPNLDLTNLPPMPIRTPTAPEAPSRSAEGQSSLVCSKCHANCAILAGYNYHISRGNCQTQIRSRFRCSDCGSYFTQKTGLDYHTRAKVCLNFKIAPPTSKKLRQTSPSPPSQQPPQPPQSQPPPQTRPPQLSLPSQSQLQPQPQPQYHSVYQPQPQFEQQSPQPRVQVQVPHKTVPSITLPTPQVTSTPQTKSPPQASSIPRPPLHTPASTPSSRKQAPREDIRQSPSDLPPEKQAELEQALNDAEQKHQDAVAAIPRDVPEEERAAKLQSLKNSIASKKSQIRKNFGVSLRLREKDKLAKKAGLKPEDFKSISGGRASSSGTPTRAPSSSLANGYSAPPPSTAPAAGTWTPTISNDGLPPVHTYAPMNQPAISQPNPLVSGFVPINQPQSLSQPAQSNKRRRTSDDYPPSRPSPSYFNTPQLGTPQPQPQSAQQPSSGLALVEVRTENAASKFPPRQLHLGQQQPAEGSADNSANNSRASSASANAQRSQMSVLKLGGNSPPAPGAIPNGNFRVKLVVSNPDIITIDSSDGEEEINKATNNKAGAGAGDGGKSEESSDDERSVEGNNGTSAVPAPRGNMARRGGYGK